MCSALAWGCRFARLWGSSRPHATTGCAGGGTNLHPLLHQAAQDGGFFLLAIPRRQQFNVSLVHGKWLFPFAPSRRLSRQSGGDEQEVITTRQRSAVGSQRLLGKGVSKQESLSRGLCGQISCQRQPASSWADGFSPWQWEGKRFLAVGGYSRARQVPWVTRGIFGCPNVAVSHPPSLRSRRRSLQLLPQPPGAHGLGRKPQLPPAEEPGQQPHLARRPEPAGRRRPDRQAPAAAGDRGLAGTRRAPP